MNIKKVVEVIDRKLDIKIQNILINNLGFKWGSLHNKIENHLEYKNKYFMYVYFQEKSIYYGYDLSYDSDKNILMKDNYFINYLNKILKNNKISKIKKIKKIKI